MSTRIRATEVKKLDGFTGDARLFKLSEPVEYDTGKTTDYVVVSATHAMFSGPETYIFPADTSGKVVDWGEMPGSFRGGRDHAAAIRGAGWSIAEEG